VRRHGTHDILKHLVRLIEPHPFETLQHLQHRAGLHAGTRFLDVEERVAPVHRAAGLRCVSEARRAVYGRRRPCGTCNTPGRGSEGGGEEGWTENRGNGEVDSGDSSYAGEGSEGAGERRPAPLIMVRDGCPGGNTIAW
jgi:hypothetical protein